MGSRLAIASDVATLVATMVVVWGVGGRVATALRRSGAWRHRALFAGFVAALLVAEYVAVHLIVETYGNELVRACRH